MKRLTLMSLSVGLALLLVACTGGRGSGTIIEENRDVSNFNGISLSNSGNVTITVGETEALTVRTDDNIMSDIITEVRGNTLVLTTRPNSAINPTTLEYDITVTTLESLVVTGSGDVIAPEIEGDAFNIEISGSGDVDIAKLDVDSLTVGMSGSGEVNIADGETDLQTVSMSGSGDYNALNFESNTSSVSITGSGSAQVNADDELTARLSGSGDLRYTGEPTVDSNVTGSGSVSPAQ